MAFQYAIAVIAELVVHIELKVSLLSLHDFGGGSSSGLLIAAIQDRSSCCYTDTAFSVLSYCVYRGTLPTGMQ